MTDNSAKSQEKSPESENQDKSIEVYFGVFFDAKDISLLGSTFNRQEYMRKGEEAVSDAKDSSIYKTVDEVAMYAKFATDILPDNPVSKAVNKALEIKDTLENKVDDVFGKVNSINDSITDVAGKVPTSFGSGTDGTDSEGDAGESLIGSRSIISKMEPKYIGIPMTTGEEKKVAILSVSTFESPYNFRIYTTGAVSNQEVKQKDSEKTEETVQISEEARKQYAKEAVEDAVNAINQQLKPCPPKLSVHFDLFGYKKDPAVNNFISEIDKFKQNPKVNELSIDYKGLYDNFHSKDEVLSSMGNDTIMRFRNLNNL